MSDEKIQVGRLAFRVEEDWWVAYYAQSDSMDGALRLGSLHMRFAQNKAYQEAFMSLMQAALGDMFAECFGTSAEWVDPVPAPEHERGSR